MIERLARIAKLLARHLPRKTLYGVTGPYLTRYRILETKPLRIFIHQFHRSDEDEELHNHPWGRAISLILSGGYDEEQRVRGSDRVASCRFRPGTINIIDAEDFHRVDLLDDEVWTLIVAGRRIQDWGFWDRHTGRYTQWETFVRARGQEPISD